MWQDTPATKCSKDMCGFKENFSNYAAFTFTIDIFKIVPLYVEQTCIW